MGKELSYEALKAAENLFKEVFVDGEYEPATHFYIVWKGKLQKIKIGSKKYEKIMKEIESGETYK